MCVPFGDRWLSPLLPTPRSKVVAASGGSGSQRGSNTCYECNISFDWPVGLNNHMNEVHGKPFPFSCTQCGKGVRSRRDLLGHMTTWHDMSKEFVCHVCNMAFGYKSALARHVAKTHGATETG